jgi:capsular polysaccharide biosynthesis protein
MVSAYLWSAYRPALFESTTILIARVDTLDYGRLQTYKEVLTSYANKERYIEQVIPIVMNDLKLDLNIYQMAEQIVIIPQPSTLTLQIKVSFQEPQTAISLSNRLADEIAYFAQQENSNKEQKTRFPSLEIVLISREAVRISRAIYINTIAGMCAGILNGYLIAYALEFLDDSINTDDQIRRTLGDEIAFLGKIPK